MPSISHTSPDKKSSLNSSSVTQETQGDDFFLKIDLDLDETLDSIENICTQIQELQLSRSSKKSPNSVARSNFYRHSPSFFQPKFSENEPTMTPEKNKSRSLIPVQRKVTELPFWRELSSSKKQSPQKPKQEPTPIYSRMISNHK
jgi:hypothetical protein